MQAPGEVVVEDFYVLRALVEDDGARRTVVEGVVENGRGNGRFILDCVVISRHVLLEIDAIAILRRALRVGSTEDHVLEEVAEDEVPGGASLAGHTIDAVHEQTMVDADLGGADPKPHRGRAVGQFHRSHPVERTEADQDFTRARTGGGRIGAETG